MATGPQPNNATPQRLQLAAHSVPRMPFSSPMGEEILSPTSPNASRSPPQHQIKLSQNQNGRKRSAGDQWKLPSQKLESDGRSVQQEKLQSKPKWPGLNVVTNLSKPPSLAQKAADGSSRQNAGLGLKRKEEGSIPPSRKASVETLGLGHQASGKSLKSLGSKGRLGDLKRGSSSKSNLSPSDRAVVIGISVSPEELAQHSASPDASPAKSYGLTEQNAIDSHASNTPAIVVTPAKEIAPWSAAMDNSPRSGRQRATSSVYSQAPHSTTVPPVPPLPPDAQKQNMQSNTEKKLKKAPPPRIVSAYTDIDEGESPDARDEFRPGTGESQLRILTKSSSMDTIATRHRSKGWWNEIISPFFPRSPMSFKAPSPPHRHHEEIQSPIMQDQSLQEARQTFPPPPGTDGLKSAHTSWTDSSIDADCEKHIDTIEPRNRDTVIMDEPQENMMRDSALIPAKFEGLGSASEYFEACLYDTHSSTPYFECINHVCSSPPQPGLAVKAGDKGIASRGIGGTEPSDPGPNASQLRPVQESGMPLANRQAPTNRFSAAFHEAFAKSPQKRPASNATIIEELDTTPDVHEAHIAPVFRAPTPISAFQPASSESRPPPEPESESRGNAGAPPAPTESATKSKSTPATVDSPLTQDRPPKRYVAVMPPDRGSRSEFEQPLSPEPLSPGQQRRASRGSIPLKNVRKSIAKIHPTILTAGKAQTREEPREQPTSIADLYPPPRMILEGPRKYEINEKDVLPSREPKPHMPLTFPKFRNCFSKAKPESKKKKWMMIALLIGLVLLIILILVLAMTLTRKGNKTPIQSNWLNITGDPGFPPIPTGISTIIQPDAVDENPDCIKPVTMWSCSLPKEEQAGIRPNAPDQPNFRVQITFQNGTNATSNITSGHNATKISSRSYGHVVNAVSAGGFIRDRLLYVRNAFSSTNFASSPGPPSLEDQTFLGNTTDSVTAPFDGEQTPFFMTFLPANKLSSRLAKRGTSAPDNSTDAFPDSTKAIPPPNTNPDGTAAGANLYPLPSSQPLRLYDRGLDTEHYGFYTYFDRSIFLKSADPVDPSSNDTTPVPDDEDGGSERDAAAVRCTWAQTRFLVQIWTKKGNSAILLHQDAANGTSSKSNHPSSSGNATSLTSSSANDFSQPGSFPYPVTITLDRHGGDITKKMIYCYGMDDRQHINATQKQFQLEDRGVGGQLVNPALGPFGNVNVTTEDGGPGGIDGGSGGCMCKWQNWGTGV